MNVDSERLRQEFRKVVARRNQSVTPKLLDQLDAHLLEALRSAAGGKESTPASVAREFSSLLADDCVGINTHIAAVSMLEARGLELTAESYANCLLESERQGEPDLGRDEDEGDELTRAHARGDAAHRIAHDRLGRDYDESTYLAELHRVQSELGYARESGLSFYDER